MLWIYKTTITNNRNGGVLVYTAIVLVLLLGMAALAVDLGQLYIGRQRAQNVCDSAAMAGSKYLTGKATCATQTGPPATYAKLCGETNNQSVPEWTVLIPETTTSGVEVTFPSGTLTSVTGESFTVQPGEAIRVEGKVNIAYLFAGVLGFDASEVSASSTIVLQPSTYIKSGLFAPLCVSEEVVFGIGGIGAKKFGEPHTLKVMDWKEEFIGAGNFGPIDLPGDPTGGNNYRDRLSGNNTDPVVIDINNPPVTANTEPGAKKGPTDQGMLGRLGHEDEIFKNDETAWADWKASYNESTGLFSPTWRIIIVPIVKDPGPGFTGRDPLVIVGYAGFFIDKYDEKSGIVTGRFIQGMNFGSGERWLIPGMGETAEPDNVMLTVRMIS